MKRLSLQWRITLMNSVFIACACIILSLLIYSTGARSIDDLGSYVLRFESPLTDTAGGEQLILDIPEDKLKEFMGELSDEIDDTKLSFAQRASVITVVITLLSGVIAYFVSGHSLKPLKRFSQSIEQLEASNLATYKGDTLHIAEFEQLSHSFERMTKRLSESFECQKNFSANAAHELKTPLARIQLEIASLNRKEGELLAQHPQFYQSLEDIDAQVDYVSKLIKTFLDYSEVQVSSLEDDIELFALADEVISDLDDCAQKSGVTLTLTGSQALVRGNDLLMYRLIFNLVENAIKYNVSGGFVHLLIESDAELARLIVLDSGIGIPKDKRKNIFNAFYRVDESRSKEIEGIGLGLSLVKGIVELHSGTIEFKENTPQGSMFIVCLPLVKTI